MNKLLNRDDFRIRVLERDSHKCVLCSKPAVDAHHILDRSLWPDGGYYISNGVSLCSEHHLEAEKTLVSCEKLRESAGITETIKPEHFYSDEVYDHWGNTELPNGMRLKGELFYQDNVQKILKEAGLLNCFLKFTKYPRTLHFPWSENLQNDDKKHTNVDFFNGKIVVVSEKLDGESCSMYRDYIHARSVDSKHHDSRNWVKSLHGKIKHDIPENYRICGENVYAKHSIYYEHLLNYFYVISIWNEFNCALSWKETVEWCSLLGLNTVPVIYQGVWDKDFVHKTYLEYCEKQKDPVEGYVVRIENKIPYKDYRISYAKFVRKNHVATSDHWMTEKIVPNKIESKI
jgi:RNA ligase